MTQKSTKSRLLLSALSLLVCISMFVGSTFAWFTDSVSSVNNIIKSGNLDVEVEYSYDGETWTKLENSESIFKDTLWEPGHTQAVALRVSNVGSLALKYSVATNIVSEKTGINVYGKEFKLSEVLKLGHSAIQQDSQVGDIYMGMLLGKRDSALQANWIGFGAPVQIPTPELLPGAAHVMVLVITMPETVGNEANHKTNEAGEDNQPKITFGVTVNATQFTYEEDSFGKDYDAGAEFGKLVYDSADLIEALKNGEEIQMADDISHGAKESNGYGKTGVNLNGGVLDGNGKTLTTTGANGTWDSAIHATGGTIKNLEIDGGFRGVFISNALTEDLILDHCKIDASVYAINSDGTAGSANEYKLIVKDSTVNGWTSFSANISVVEFNNTKLGKDSGGYGYKFFRPFTDVVFTGCEFEEGYMINITTTGIEVVLNQCTVNGTVLTEGNYRTLLNVDDHTATMITVK